MEVEECYRTLEVRHGASVEEIRQSYKTLVKVWHPDRFGHDQALRLKAGQKLASINEAYEALQNLRSPDTSPSPAPAPEPEAAPTSTRSETAREQGATAPHPFVETAAVSDWWPTAAEFSGLTAGVWMFQMHAMTGTASNAWLAFFGFVGAAVTVNVTGRRYPKAELRAWGLRLVLAGAVVGCTFAAKGV